MDYEIRNCKSSVEVAILGERGREFWRVYMVILAGCGDLRGVFVGGRLGMKEG